jgi:hypothetical protein
MFTTGSKLFLGGTVLSLVSTIVYAATTGDGQGWAGTIGLVSVTVAFAFLTGINYYMKDGNVPSMQQGATTTSAAAQPPAGRSMWPLLGALGAGLIVVGADTRPLVFKMGVVIVLATLVEWLVQAWSERASGDVQYNAGLRKRLLHPIEIPVLAAVGLAVLAYSFSRIMLWIEKSGGPVLFVVAGALVLAGGFIFANRPNLKKSVIAGVCTVGALGLVSVGAVAAIDGQRKIHEYPTTSFENSEVCELAGEADDEELAEIDEKASQVVSAKSSLAAEVVLENGQLSVFVNGLQGAQKVLTLARSNPSNVLFRNLDEEHRRFTVHQGQFSTVDSSGITDVQTPTVCTPLVEEDGEHLLTLLFPKSSEASDEGRPYTIEVPGIEGQEIEVVVP